MDWDKEKVTDRMGLKMAADVLYNHEQRLAYDCGDNVLVKRALGMAVDALKVLAARQDDEPDQTNCTICGNGVKQAAVNDHSGKFMRWVNYCEYCGRNVRGGMKEHNDDDRGRSPEPGRAAADGVQHAAADCAGDAESEERAVTQEQTERAIQYLKEQAEREWRYSLGMHTYRISGQEDHAANHRMLKLVIAVMEKTVLGASIDNEAILTHLSILNHMLFHLRFSNEYGLHSKRQIRDYNMRNAALVAAIDALKRQGEQLKKQHPDGFVKPEDCVCGQVPVVAEERVGVDRGEEAAFYVLCLKCSDRVRLDGEGELYFHSRAEAIAAWNACQAGLQVNG